LTVAKLYVTEFSELPAARSNGHPQMVQQPPLVDQAPVSIGVTHAESATFGAATRIVRLHSDAACSILFGPAGSTIATANNQRMAANQTEYFYARPGDVVSVIQNS